MERGLKNYPHVFAFGDMVEMVKTETKTALNGYIVALNNCKQPIPEILKDDYELVYKFEVEELLKYIDGTVTKTALEKAAGIHHTQLIHYSSGLKIQENNRGKK